MWIHHLTIYVSVYNVFYDTYNVTMLTRILIIIWVYFSPGTIIQQFKNFSKFRWILYFNDVFLIFHSRHERCLLLITFCDTRTSFVVFDIFGPKTKSLAYLCTTHFIVYGLHTHTHTHTHACHISACDKLWVMSIFRVSYAKYYYTYRLQTTHWLRDLFMWL